MSEENNGGLSVVITTDLTKELPAQIAWNYENLKAELAKTLEPLHGLVLTKDDDGIKFAKEKRAYVNKLGKMLTDARVSTKKAFLKPFEDFEEKANELITMCRNASGEFDVFVKDAENEQKEKKRQEYTEYLHSRLIEVFAGDEETLKSRFWNEFLASEPRWLNATYKITQIKGEIDAKVDDVKKAIDTVESLFGSDAEVIEKARIEIKKDFNLTNTVNAVKAYRAEQRRIRDSEEARRAREEQARKDKEAAMEAAKRELEEKRKAAAANAAASGQGAPVPAEKPVVAAVATEKTATADTVATEPKPSETTEKVLNYTLRFDGANLAKVLLAVVNCNVTCKVATLELNAPISKFKAFRGCVDSLNGVNYKKV